MISVNGAPRVVQVGAQFPSRGSHFTLVSLTTKDGQGRRSPAARWRTAAATITLTKNKPLTLMNTADGTRYVLRLVSR